MVNRIILWKIMRQKVKIKVSFYYKIANLIGEFLFYAN